MLSYWTSAASSSIDNVCEDTRTLALHVLSYAGFGVQQDYASGVRSAEPILKGHEMSFHTALWTVMSNMFVSFLTAMLPTWVRGWCVGSWCVPQDVKKIVRAMDELEQYMRESLEELRGKMHIEEKQNGGRPNLMSTLIRSSEEHGEGGRPQLSDKEILGNIFIFNIAGHETTANTTSFALAVLALHQDLQKWVREELVRWVVGEDSCAEKYGHVFPKLVRCQAVMVS